MLELRLLPPRSHRHRTRPPEWEIIDEAGAIVGWIEQHHIGGAARPFFNLRGIHPTTGETIPLELSADLSERLARLADFRSDPDRFHVHYPSGSLARKAIEDRVGGPAWQLGTGTPGRHG